MIVNLKRLEHHYRPLWTFVVAVGISLLLSLGSLSPSRAIPVSDVSDPRQDNNWVMDQANILRWDSEQQLQQMIAGLVAKRGTELIVVTVPDIKPLASSSEFAYELLNHWETDESAMNDCVLLLVSEEGPHAAIKKGKDVKTLDLSLRTIDKILTTQIYPAFEQGSFEVGIVNGAQAVIEVLEQEDPSEIYSLPADVPIIGVILMMFVVALGFVISTLVLWSLTFAALVLTPGVVLMSIVRKSQVLRVAPVGCTTLSNQGSRLRWIRTSLLHWLRTGKASVGGEETLPIYKGIHFTRPIIQSWWIFFGSYSSVGVVFSHQTTARHVHGLVMGFLVIWLGYELWWWAKHDDHGGSETVSLFRGLFRSNVVAIILVLILASILKVPILWTALAPYLITAFGGAWAGTLLLMRSLTRYTEVHCQSCNGLMQCLEPKTVESYLKPAEKAAKTLKSTSHVGWECPTCRPPHTETDVNIHLFREVVKSDKFGHCSECDAYTVRNRKARVVQPAQWFVDGEKQIVGRCVYCEQSSEVYASIPCYLHRLIKP